MKCNRFTLIEVMISSILVGVAAVSIYMSMSVSRKTVLAAREQERASALVTERINDMSTFLVRELAFFANRYPNGRVEEIPQPLWSVSDNNSGGSGTSSDSGTTGINFSSSSRREIVDYTPELRNPVMTSWVFDYDTCCKIEVELSWEDSQLDERRSVKNHVFKYKIER